ncbi:hydrophobic surface binding protein A-domain-containing protein [Mycena rosella]|uniref:Hydrophobic surface binding protein A-domain-containing protein n=1 Tax=Mycena rosella TaxID=1033263 RepID=A0AAD7D3E2_MYCRO|nr:hydrophobic surface binding protein A-domain-containing protein [Mycena rosella]
MVQISRFFTVLSVAAVGLALSVKRTVAVVEADIAKISTQVTTLDNAIEAYPLTGGSLLNALTIHTDATTLITTLKTATADVTANGALDEADGRTILTSVEAIEPTILDALTDIVIKKPAFAALPIGGLPALILQDLTNLKASTVAFAAALVANAPADLVTEATTVQGSITAAFDPAIAAYTA